MNQSLFTAKVSFLPRVDCSENEIKAVTLGKTLLSDKWRAKVEAIRREKDQEKRKALKAALPEIATRFTVTSTTRRFCVN